MGPDRRAAAHGETAASTRAHRKGRHRSTRRNHRYALTACAAAALAIAAVTGTAFGRPETTSSKASYEQNGRLSYTAPVGRSSIYGPAGLSSGQPVYSVAVKYLHISFTYHLQSASPAIVSGTERLVAAISNGQGIVRTIPLVKPTAFSGDHFVATAVLRLATLERLAAVFERAVGAQLYASAYSVTFTPSVVIAGKLAGAPLLARFDPSIPFTYGGGVLTPTSVSGSSADFLGAPGTASSATAAGPRPQLTVSATGAVPLPGSQTSYLFGDLTDASARHAALVALALFLVLGALAGRSFARAAVSRDERARIASRHRAVLVPVEAFPTAPEVVIVEISTFQGLMRIARRLECPLLFESNAEASAYGVVDNGTLYRYRPVPLLASGRAAAGQVPERVETSIGGVVRELANWPAPPRPTPARETGSV